MSMNDEQFEEAMKAFDNFFITNMTADLRARDSAQREALARVEAERDQITQDIQRFASQLLTTKAQLAEAVGLLRSAEHQLVSFHREHESQWCGYLDDALGVIKHIIARHAQAEQQEARVSKEQWQALAEAEQTLDAVASSREERAKRLGLVQGEQAWDEREAFEATLAPSLSRETFVDEEGDTIYCDTWVQGASIGWRRSAALATRPAEWVDPVALHPAENLYNQGFADGVSEAKRLNAVRGAEHG